MIESDQRSRMTPPLPCLLGFFLGVACDWVWPWPVGPYPFVLPTGVFLLVLVGLSVAHLLQTFERHGTASDPKEEATAIIDTGLFRFSRNPGYLTAGALQASLGLLLNNVWVLLTVLPALFVIDRVVVLREEAYLEDRFGEPYLEYKAKVRRWI